MQYKRCRVQLRAKGIIIRDVVHGRDIKTKRQQLCKAGEFLVAEIDAKVGGFGIVPNELDGAIVSSHYFLFELDKTKLDKRFLAYYVKTPAFQEQIEAQGSTNYAAIRPHQVLDYVIPLPALDEQGNLVSIMSKIEDARQLHEAAVTELDALASALLAKAFQGEL
jgi:type I restriction enzyme S subunit